MNKHSKRNQCNQNLKKKRKRKRLKRKKRKNVEKRKDTLGQAAALSSAQGASLSEGRPGRQTGLHRCAAAIMNACKICILVRSGW